MLSYSYQIIMEGLLWRKFFYFVHVYLLESVLYLNTFSKTIAPSIRVGYMVLPMGLLSEFESKLGFYSCTVPTYIQLVLAELISSGDFERHINRVRRRNRRNVGQGKWKITKEPCGSFVFLFRELVLCGNLSYVKILSKTIFVIFPSQIIA